MLTARSSCPDADDGLSGVEIEISIETDDASTQAAEGSEEVGTAATTSQTTPVAATRAPVQGMSCDCPCNVLSLTNCLVSRNQILQLLGHAGLRRIFASHGGAGFGLADLGEDDDEDNGIEGGYGSMVGRRRRRRKSPKAEFPKVPSSVGRELMDSGNFGSNEYYRDVLRRRKQKLASRVMSRELGLDSAHDKRGNKLLCQVSKSSHDACSGN